MEAFNNNLQGGKKLVKALEKQTVSAGRSIPALWAHEREHGLSDRPSRARLAARECAAGAGDSGHGSRRRDRGRTYVAGRWQRTRHQAHGRALAAQGRRGEAVEAVESGRRWPPGGGQACAGGKFACRALIHLSRERCGRRVLWRTFAIVACAVLCRPPSACCAPAACGGGDRALDLSRGDVGTGRDENSQTSRDDALTPEALIRDPLMMPAARAHGAPEERTFEN